VPDYKQYRTKDIKPKLPFRVKRLGFFRLFNSFLEIICTNPYCIRIAARYFMCALFDPKDFKIQQLNLAMENLIAATRKEA